ncbi:MAG: thioredoxin [Candidatus Omnitrophota bacterium]
MEHIRDITKDNFDKEVVKAKLPVIIDFWAEWCMPCKMLSPVIDEVAKEFAGKLRIGKINVDEDAELASELMVMNIPTLLFFKDGREVKRAVGVLSKKELLKKIDEAFSE